MAERQVIKAQARLFPHPNAERLELCKVGPFQLVVRRGEYQDGDSIVIAPERAILPPHLAGRYVNADTGASYLHGPSRNRVGAVRLRGEVSQGVVLEVDGLEDLPFARRESRNTRAVPKAVEMDDFPAEEEDLPF